MPVQDEQKLFLGMEACKGGDLYEQLQARHPLPLSDVRFYAAEMVCILDCLRQHRVVYRCASTAPIRANAATFVLAG